VLRLSAETIKGLILHPDADVRAAAVRYCTELQPPDLEVAGLAIQAYQQFGLEAFKIDTFLSLLEHTDESIAWVLSQLECVDSNLGPREEFFVASLKHALKCCPPELLKPHLAALEALKNLTDDDRRTIADRIAADALSADELWAELGRVCEQRDAETEDRGELFDHGTVIVMAMARWPEVFGSRVLQGLRNADVSGGWLEVYLVKLAGEMRFEPAISLLADRLADPDSYAGSEAIKAIEAIGTDAVVRELDTRYAAVGWDDRFLMASILCTVHTDLSVETCLQWLAHEAGDEGLQQVLLESILANFSPEGIEPARQLILKSQKTLSILQLRQALLATCKALGVTFPEFEAWEADARLDRQFREDLFQQLFWQIADEELAVLQEEEATEPEYQAPRETLHRQPHVGRNDPCPCGSGKKFKKCCYGKETLVEKLDSSEDAPDAAAPAALPAQKFPIGTIARYGPDDRATTKIVAGVIRRQNAEPILERWVGTNIASNPKVDRQIAEFFQRHHVKSVVANHQNMGCPHEEGIDFPSGEDCPFCAFWSGKQGTARREL
jgi:hypothetical protein